MTGTDLFFGAVALFAALKLVFGLRSGVTWYSTGWVFREKEPSKFWTSTTGAAAALLASLTALYFLARR